jgi:hypothetical protein
VFLRQLFDINFGSFDLGRTSAVAGTTCLQLDDNMVTGNVRPLRSAALIRLVDLDSFGIVGLDSSMLARLRCWL